MEMLLVGCVIALVGWSYARKLLPPRVAALVVRIVACSVVLAIAAAVVAVLPDSGRGALGALLLLVGLVAFVRERRERNAAAREARAKAATAARGQPRRRVPPPAPGSRGP